jgi:hypothetical protein
MIRCFTSLGRNAPKWNHFGEAIPPQLIDNDQLFMTFDGSVKSHADLVDRRKAFAYAEAHFWALGALL